MDEVTVEQQAAMAIILQDKVRELVRAELREALEDPVWVNQLQTHQLMFAVTRHICTDYNFQNAVKQLIINQMQK